MSLNDLVITNKKISKDLVEKVLKGRVELVREGNKVNLTKEGSKLSNKLKVLLFLAGGKAWELLDNVTLSFSPNEMEQVIGIPGNSLRPILKEISDNYLVNNEKGKYQIIPKGIYELENMLENTIKENDKTQKGNSKMVRKSKPTKKGNSPLKSEAIKELIKDGYFSTPKDNSEIMAELGRRGVTVKPTSLPSFILPLLRKKSLTRDYKLKNKRKVWVYKISETKH